MRRRWVSVLRGGAAALIVSLVALPALAAMPEGWSEWSGNYFYDDGGGVPFSWSLTVSNGRITGRSTENATFGDGSSPILTADLVGSASGDSVSIVKTYDGSGGQTHSIQYFGSLSSGGKTISGRWSLTGASGSFSISLVRAEAQESMCRVCGQALKSDVLAGIDGAMPDTYTSQSLAKYDNCARRQPNECRGTCASTARDTVAFCFGKGYNDAGFVACIKQGIAGLADVPCDE